MLKVAAPQVARLVGLQVVRRAVQPVEPQVVQPGEALQVVPLAVQLVPVRQAQLEPRVLLERRVPQARLPVRSLGLLALSAWSVR